MKSTCDSFSAFDVRKVKVCSSKNSTCTTRRSNQIIVGSLQMTPDVFLSVRVTYTRLLQQYTARAHKTDGQQVLTRIIHQKLVLRAGYSIS